ncbi:hypothetical protein HY229_09475 [Candidatus Acetothermia bacterium]|nr:hypothetical protein [Candidatus Acetothermia bacterium]MBI3644313.1 hypothetical protein [Candidatus Acetothermia bacterium]
MTKRPLLPPQEFARRVALSFSFGLAVIFFSLILGILGYRLLEKLTWTDSFVSAAMILSGMGPAFPLHSQAGKIFAGLYSLYSGVAFILSCGIIFAPIVHRFLHFVHLEISE